MKSVLILAALIAALFLTGCPESAGPANTDANNAANGGSNNSAGTTEDASAAVIDLEKKAHEAWKNKDGKFFEGMLADDFTGVVGGNIVDKDGLVKQISESPCEVKSYEMSDPKTTKINDSAMIVTHRLSFDYTCDGKAVKSPEYVVSVYVKEGDSWKGAFHQSVPAADAKGDMSAMPDSTGLKGTDDAQTDELVKLENAAWDAWAKGETEWFSENMTADAIHVTPGGVEGRDDMVKMMKETKCDVEEYGSRGFTRTELADNVQLLMYRGNQKGKCGDMELPPVVIAATVAVKEGDSWKGVLHIETPAK